MVVSLANRYRFITDFYIGKSIFITGGTGFLGKVVIEKLLYSCPGIDKVYMLIREKRGFSINERMKSCFDDPIFDRLKEKKPQYLQKIVPIPGEITAHRLGMSHEHEKTLIEKTSIVVHSAATVKFNKPLKVAWQINVEGTETVLDLSQKMKNLEVFVHISTAYSNINRDVVEEVLYPPPADINDIRQIVKQNLSQKETLKIIKGCPNTYIFTKALAEHLIAKNQALVPSIIIRPSIITPIEKEPVKGWLPNSFGATEISKLTAIGLNRVIYGNENNIVDIIPVDYVANLTIAAAAKGNRSNELKIYNSCTGGSNPLTYRSLFNTFAEETKKHNTNIVPFSQWYLYTKYKWLLSLATFLFQIVPAYLLDIYQMVTNQEAKYVKLQSRAIQIRNSVNFCTSGSWIMKNDRTRELYSSLPEEDKKIFPCDPTEIDWRKYLLDYTWGVRQFLEKKRKMK